MNASFILKIIFVFDNPKIIRSYAVLVLWGLVRTAKQLEIGIKMLA